MIRIRHILGGEVLAFASVGTPAQGRPDVQAYVRSMLERGVMRTDWCYLAESGGRVAGRIALWTLPAIGRPLSIVLWDVQNGSKNSTQTARALADHALAAAHAAGSDELEYVIDDPPQSPQWQDNLTRRLAWPDDRFRLRRMTLRYKLETDSPPAPVPPSTPDLVFYSLPEVGEQAFTKAIERVSAGSLDRHTAAQRARLGPSAEAEQMWDELNGLEYEPPWWELATTSAGELVGLVMPCANPTSATIGYIGVVPEMRGRGHIDALLRRGTATLRQAGYGLIQADTDIDNRPMAAAFQRAGYKRFATRREYVVTAAVGRD